MQSFVGSDSPVCASLQNPSEDTYRSARGTHEDWLGSEVVSATETCIAVLEGRVSSVAEVQQCNSCSRGFEKILFYHVLPYETRSWAENSITLISNVDS